MNPNTIQRTFQELERDGVVVTRRGMGRYVTNEGRKLWSCERDGERITSFFYRWNGQFRFSEEEILTILRSSLHDKREESQ